MQTCNIKATFATQARSAVRPRASGVVCMANFDAVKKVAAGFGVGVASLALTGAAFAGANVKLGADNGSLVFDPATVTIAKGDTVTWTNNAGFPHNIVFDADEIPAGSNADALSHEDYLNAPGESHTAKFDVSGEYPYFCEPHQGAGMVGKVIVQ